MHLYYANQGEKEGLEEYYLRLAGQAAKCGVVEDAENEVIRKIIIAKISPGANIDETLRAALLQEIGYVTANTLQKQNSPFSTSGNPIRIKQVPTMSTQLRNNGENWTNRALQDNRKNQISGSNLGNKSLNTVRPW